MFLLSKKKALLTDFAFADCVKLQGSLKHATIAELLGSFKYLINFGFTKTLDVAQNL